MRAFSKSDREQNSISVNLDLSSSYAPLLDTCFLKFISNSSCFGYLCKTVISVLGFFFLFFIELRDNFFLCNTFF